MEVRGTVVLLGNSTISKEAHLRRYADLLDQIATAGTQPALGAKTTRISPRDRVSHTSFGIATGNPLD